MTIRIRSLLIATALAATAPLAMAGTTAAPTAPQQSQASSMQAKQLNPMMGEHNMPGTVTAVDHKTGIVKLKSLGMSLVVHFPPPTIKELKVGDNISLHLGYRLISH